MPQRYHTDDKKLVIPVVAEKTSSPQWLNRGSRVKSSDLRLSDHGGDDKCYSGGGGKNVIPVAARVRHPCSHLIGDDVQ
jgi:hypothetical protein